MKFKTGDQVLVTGGKDKGKKGAILKVLPQTHRVIVDGVNLYVKHMKPIQDRPGQRVVKPRPLPLGKVAILNEKGQADRIGYQVTKDGQKTRIFKKSGQAVPEPKAAKK